MNTGLFIWVLTPLFTTTLVGVACARGIARALHESALGRVAPTNLDVGDYVERAFAGLEKGSRVVGISDRSAHDPDAAGQLRGDRQTRGIVAGGVDPLPGGQSLEVPIQPVGGSAQITPSVEGRHIGIDAQAHDYAPKLTSQHNTGDKSVSFLPLQKNIDICVNGTRRAISTG